MKKAFQTLFALTLLCLAASAQKQAPSKKGKLYFGFGTNRSFYGKSNISVSATGTPNFDFELKKVKAKDDGGLKFDNGGAAQYSYQLGYYSEKKNFGIEFNFDHIKYFVTPGQTVRITGQINGSHLDKDTVLHQDFFQMEHSDGGNYALINFVKWKQLAASADQRHILNLLLKAGAGPVIPKTNSTIMGRHYDDMYKISGYVVALEGGVRFQFFKYFYVAPTLKGAYANYTNFVIANGEGHQQWMALHFDILLGAQLSL
jgi:hypothetical protein